MDRSGAMELRKLFGNEYKEGESAAGNIAGCIVTGEKEIKGEFTEKLLKEKKDTVLKYHALFRKAFGNDNMSARFKDADKEDGGMQFLLDKMRATGLANKDINRIFFEKAAEALPEGTYAVLLVHYRYDVPIKSKNKEKQKDGYGGDGIYGNESEEVYSFITCAICPIRTDKGSLGYWEDRIGENPQLRTLSPTAAGFVFPDFTDRSSDADQASIYRTDKLDISKALFGQALPELTKPEPKPKEEKPEKNDAFAADPVPKEIEMKPPSQDSGFTSPTDDGDDDDIGRDDPKGYDAPQEGSSQDDGMTETEIKTALSMPRTNDRPVRITGDKQRISKRVINGKQYWVIAIEDAFVD